MTETKIDLSPYHNQPDGNSILYRYMTIDKLLDFLFNGRIPLVKLSLFEDKLEGVDVNHLLWNYVGDKISENTANWMGGLFKQITINAFPDKRNTYRRQREKFQNSNFASCWYINNHESVAMWQLYSKPDSVAIRIPFKEFSEELTANNFNLSESDCEKLRYGCIEYYKFNDPIELGNISLKAETHGFVKDSSFKHEQEFRILAQAKEIERKTVNRKPMILDEQLEKLNSYLNKNIIHMTLSNFKNLPFEIIFHPQSFSWHRQNIQKILDQFEIPFKTSKSVLTDIFK